MDQRHANCSPLIIGMNAEQRQEDHATQEVARNGETLRFATLPIGLKRLLRAIDGVMQAS